MRERQSRLGVVWPQHIVSRRARRDSNPCHITASFGSKCAVRQLADTRMNSVARLPFRRARMFGSLPASRFLTRCALGTTFVAAITQSGRRNRRTHFTPTTWMPLQCAPSPISTLSSCVDLAAIRGLLGEARPDVLPNAAAYRAAVFLLCGPALGCNVDRITRITRYSASQVAIVVRRLFDNGIWHHHGPVYTWRGPGDEDFWRDVAVAEGKLRRRSVDSSGHIEWLPVGTRRLDHAGHMETLQPMSSSSRAQSSLANSRLSSAANSLFPNARWL